MADYRTQIEGYHRMSMVAQVRPAPKPLKRTKSPRWILPSRYASSRAKGMLADEVLPYLDKLQSTRSLSILSEETAESIIRRFA